MVTARIDGNDVPLTFDLGDTTALVLSQKVLDRITTVPIGKTHRSRDMQGNVIQSAMFKLPQLKIGDATFIDVIGRPDLHDPSYPAADVGQQGYFGTSLLQSYKVVLDYRRKPAGTDMFVGYNFFANHIVCIDFPRHRFLIRR